MQLIIKILNYYCSNFLTINAIAPNDIKKMIIRNVVMILVYESVVQYTTSQQKIFKQIYHIRSKIK